ncbi:GtrA family protein [Microtetraspora sp. AC03309]|uniref:GtrA family protein n=1 Tax=Microtetraspora sp. AC03309 TaxID=2779376 RepID=UPI001E3D77C7|nr:GtrA family protein [Microtetraspora sp. AC03309]MCC5577029.1 GtrA family protein [Microtetraspora sp. AC03309]
MLELKSRSARENPTVRRALIPAFLGQRITYLLAGAMTAGVYYALLCLGLLVAKNAVPYLFLVVVSHFITVVLVYPAYRLVVFKVSGVGWLSGYLRFYAVGLSFLGLSVIGLPILVEFAGIPIMVAQGLIILMSPPLSYAIHRAWTFR